MPNGTAFAGQHPIVPLTFDPTKLKGFSERLIRSHHENNYGDAVKNLNRVEEELAHLTKGSPPFVVAALKERELTFRNSAILHEHYFANGGDGRPDGAIESVIDVARRMVIHTVKVGPAPKSLDVGAVVMQ
jgi:superoxide dismutase, Fe-Mn family